MACILYITNVVYMRNFPIQVIYFCPSDEMIMNVAQKKRQVSDITEDEIK